MGFVIVESIGDGTIQVEDNSTTAQIIVEVGVGQMTNTEFAALLATKQDAFGNPDNADDYIRFEADGTPYFDPGYTHPSETPINLASASGKAIKSLQTNSLGHVTNATQGTVEEAEEPLEIVDTDSEDILVGDKTQHRIMIVNYGASSGSVPQVGEIHFMNLAGTVSFLPSKKKSITGVTLAKYEDGNNIYLRVTNNSGDTLWFEYSLTQYDILT